MRAEARPGGGSSAPATENRATVPESVDGRSRKRELFALSAGFAADVHLFVERRVSNVEDANDITQQAMTVACAEMDRLRGTNPLSWVLAIARNLIVDHYRTQKRYQFVELNETLAQSEPALQMAANAPSSADDHRERLSALLNQIAGVCLEHQVAILLSDIYGHSDKHSASALHMSLPSFKLLLHGARARLRQNSARVSETNPGRMATTNPREMATTAPGVRMRRLGVNCYLSTAELLELREQLLAGLKLR